MYKELKDISNEEGKNFAKANPDAVVFIVNTFQRQL